jgi:putative ABC transport system permease protein
LSIGGFAVRNLLRNKLRSALTAAGVAISVLAFILLRTILFAWTIVADFASKDRVATRNLAFAQPVPKKYVDRIRMIRGVKEVTYAIWFGGRAEGRDGYTFPNLAVDPQTFLAIYDEVSLSSEARARFLATRNAAIVGRTLAKKMGWKEGDRIVLVGSFYPGDWQLEIAGVYASTRKSLDETTLFFRWDYLNEAVGEHRKDRVGWILSQVEDPALSASVSTAIDKAFETDEPTLSMSEGAVRLSFLGTVSAAFRAIELASAILLAIMMLIVGNTIAMSVRERSREYATLQAIGFRRRHLIAFVIGEACALGSLGGLLGLAFAYPLVEKLIGSVIEEDFGSILPYFRIAPSTAAAAPILAVLLALCAAIVPAYSASRSNVIDGLRRVG